MMMHSRSLLRRSILALSLAVFGALPLAAEQASPVQQQQQMRATALMSRETQLVIELLEKMHYSNRPLADADFSELITDYMQRLDARRLFFLKADHDAYLAKFAGSLGERMRISGTIDPAFEIFADYRRIADERLAWVAEHLKSDFDLNADDAIVLDRSEAPWPDTREEADRLWDQRLRGEIIEEMLSDKTVEQARETVAKRYERTARTINEIEAQEVQETFLTSLMQVYDPHSTFFSAETMEDFSIGMRLSLIGIGALLGLEDDYCVIRELVPGGPAKLSGQLKPNDKIVAVAQEGQEPVEVMGFKLRKVVNLIRGERGTKVTLTIVPGEARDTSERRTLTLVRETIRLDDSRARASVHEVPGKDGGIERIGVITIPAFYGAEAQEGRERVSVTADVRELLKLLEPENISSLVLDLRRNGGGLLTEAIELTGLFIPRGPVVQIRDAFDRRMVRSDENRSVEYAGPLVVLTDRFTASASEIVAGALQNYGRAVVAGNRSTHGKGTVQQIFELKDFMGRPRSNRTDVGAAKLTVQKFYLPNGDSTQRQGVIPDIILPSVEDLMKIGEADLTHALQWDRIDASRFSPVAIKQDLSGILRTAAAQRMAELPEFDFLRRSIALFKERQDAEELPLNLEVRRQMRETDKALTEEMKAQGADLAKADFPKREFHLPGVSEEENEKAPEAEKEDETPMVDVHLREGLRIAADLSRLTRDGLPAPASPIETAGTSTAPGAQ